MPKGERMMCPCEKKGDGGEKKDPAWQLAPGTLLPFTINPECPKCMSVKITTRYCGGVPLDSQKTSEEKPCVYGPGEHLHRSCECGFEWGEKCGGQTE